MKRSKVIPVLFLMFCSQFANANTAAIESCVGYTREGQKVILDIGYVTHRNKKSVELHIGITEGEADPAPRYYFTAVIERTQKNIGLAFAQQAGRGLLLTETTNPVPGETLDATALLVRHPENTFVAYHGQVMVFAGCK